MAPLKLMSVNGEDMIDLVPQDLSAPTGADKERGEGLGELISSQHPDVLGLVEGAATEDRTAKFVELYLNSAYYVHQGELRGTLGIALLARKSLGLTATVRTKDQSTTDFPLDKHDSDNDGIKELYSWADRVPVEVELSGGELAAPVTFIVLHSKSKGVFIPGDLFAYERVSRANRMKLKVKAAAVRKRIDALITPEGGGRVIVMGDFNDGPEFDVDAAMIGGGFLEPVMGSVWDPHRVLHDPHVGMDPKERWTIDFADRIVNPMKESKFGDPTTLRSWIDHILFSPYLVQGIVPGSAGIARHGPGPGSPTDHHPPFVSAQL